MPRTQATSRVQATSRAQASGRAVFSVPRLPQMYRNDFGITNMWDFREGYLGNTTKRNVDDLYGALHMGMENFEDADWTVGQFNITPDGSEYLYTADGGMRSVGGDSSATFWGWCNNTNVTISRTLMSQYDILNNRRTFQIQQRTDNTLRLTWSDTGTAVRSWTTNAAIPNPQANWNFFCITWNGTGANVDIFVGDSTTTPVELASALTSVSFGGTTFHSSNDVVSLAITKDSSDAFNNSWIGSLGLMGICSAKILTSGEITSLWDDSRKRMGLAS